MISPLRFRGDCHDTMRDTMNRDPTQSGWWKLTHQSYEYAVYARGARASVEREATEHFECVAAMREDVTNIKLQGDVGHEFLAKDLECLIGTDAFNEICEQIQLYDGDDDFHWNIDGRRIDNDSYRLDGESA